MTLDTGLKEGELISFLWYLKMLSGTAHIWPSKSILFTGQCLEVREFMGVIQIFKWGFTMNEFQRL